VSAFYLALLALAVASLAFCRKHMTRPSIVIGVIAMNWVCYAVCFSPKRDTGSRWRLSSAFLPELRCTAPYGHIGHGQPEKIDCGVSRVAEKTKSEITKDVRSEKHCPRSLWRV